MTSKARSSDDDRDGTRSSTPDSGTSGGTGEQVSMYRQPGSDPSGDTSTTDTENTPGGTADGSDDGGTRRAGRDN